jgi:hypothetical protein
MFKFDIDETSNESENTPMITCQIHGDYPASLKKYGCPDCAADELDDEEFDDWRERQVRKVTR